jgi:hypothetical protein
MGEHGGKVASASQKWFKVLIITILFFYKISGIDHDKDKLI